MGEREEQGARWLSQSVSEQKPREVRTGGCQRDSGVLAPIMLRPPIREADSAAGPSNE